MRYVVVDAKGNVLERFEAYFDEDALSAVVDYGLDENCGIYEEHRSYRKVWPNHTHTFEPESAVIGHVRG